MTKPPNEEADYDELVRFLQEARAFDFASYKRSGLQRRLRRRMTTVGVSGWDDYRDYLELNPAEVDEVLDAILINVTSFLRDPAIWDAFASERLPAMRKQLAADQHLRIWCAGCSSGEEAYTTAMVVGETFGLKFLRERVKIYATDIDEPKLAVARAGSFGAKALEPLPEDWVGRYFKPSGDSMAFRRDLRPSIIFGRNDLLTDPPISQLDALICRNTLMYFHAAAQDRVLARFQFALRPGGTLMVGRSEMLTRHGDAFRSLPGKHHFFEAREEPASVARTMKASKHSTGDADAGRSADAENALAAARLDLKAAIAQYQMTSAELEATNEELQSSNEELETTNEELQSTNEELETIIEEFQSTNEELETVNDHAQVQTDRLHAMNVYLEGILASLSAAVVVVDPELRVQLWSPRAQELWGLTAAEVTGQPLLDLDSGFPVAELEAPIRAILSDGSTPMQTTLAAVNRRGRSLVINVSYLRLHTATAATHGVVLVVDEVAA